MIISDLNHLEVVDQQASVVGGIANISAVTYLYFEEYVDVYKTFDVYSVVSGNSAFAEADASAYGDNSHAEALTFTYTDEYFSSASATSLSMS